MTVEEIIAGQLVIRFRAWMGYTARFAGYRHLHPSLFCLDESGVYSILSSLAFLHDRVGVCHNNVALSSVFVTVEDGAWKLGALDHLKTYSKFIKNRFS